jgi:hypothetical protein
MDQSTGQHVTQTSHGLLQGPGREHGSIEGTSQPPCQTPWPAAAACRHAKKPRRSPSASAGVPAQARATAAADGRQQVMPQLQPALPPSPRPASAPFTAPGSCIPRSVSPAWEYPVQPVRSEPALGTRQDPLPVPGPQNSSDFAGPTPSAGPAATPADPVAAGNSPAQHVTGCPAALPAPAVWHSRVLSSRPVLTSRAGAQSVGTATGRQVNAPSSAALVASHEGRRPGLGGLMQGSGGSLEQDNLPAGSGHPGGSMPVPHPRDSPHAAAAEGGTSELQPRQAVLPNLPNRYLQPLQPSLAPQQAPQNAIVPPATGPASGAAGDVAPAGSLDLIQGLASILSAAYSGVAALPGRPIARLSGDTSVFELCVALASLPQPLAQACLGLEVAVWAEVLAAVPGAAAAAGADGNASDAGGESFSSVTHAAGTRVSQ